VVDSVSSIQEYEERLKARQGDLWIEIGNQNSASPCFLPAYLYYGREKNPNIWQRAFAPGSAGWSSFDDAIEGCLVSYNQIKAAEYTAIAMHILVDEARVVIPLASLYNIWFSSDRVLGFTPHPIAGMVLWSSITKVY
jgi:hypothetical protein